MRSSHDGRHAITGGAVALALLATACSETPTPTPDVPAAIAEVFAVDTRLGRERNHAPETGTLADAVRDYVSGLDAIDFGACPEEFTRAFVAHRDAWEASIELFERHGELRGEMHDLFERIRALDDASREELERVEAAIWDTWDEVSAAAARHGFVEPTDG